MKEQQAFDFVPAIQKLISLSSDSRAEARNFRASQSETSQIVIRAEMRNGFFLPRLIPAKPNPSLDSKFNINSCALGKHDSSWNSDLFRFLLLNSEFNLILNAQLDS